MGKFFDEIPDEEHVQWILDQKIFWVATAPLSQHGHVNTSPKGRPTLTLVGKSACWYTDMTGSGNETISHLYENGRITVMFSAFEGPPRIVRFFGTGTVFERGSPEFEELLPEGDERILPGTRAIIWVDIHKVGTSCGYSVPFFDYTGERLVLDNHFAKVQDGSHIRPDGLPQKLMDYWNLKNSFSIDSMRGLKFTDDPSKTLKPPFKLEDGENGTLRQAVHEKSEHATGRIGLSSFSIGLLLGCMFVLGIVAGIGLQSGRSLVAI